MLARREWILLALLLTAPITGAAGNVITDWDAKAAPGSCRSHWADRRYGGPSVLSTGRAECLTAAVHTPAAHVSTSFGSQAHGSLSVRCKP